MQIIFESLSRRLQENVASSSTSVDKNRQRWLKVKCDFQGDKRLIELSRPPKLSDLVRKLNKYYDCSFSLRFVLANEQSSFPICNQSDMDKAVGLTDLNERVRSLRVLVERCSVQHSINSSSAALMMGTSPPNQRYTPDNRFPPQIIPSKRTDMPNLSDSPPPGTLRGAEGSMTEHHDASSLRSGGFFVPDEEEEEEEELCGV